MAEQDTRKVKRAIECAKKAATGDPGLSGIYLARFHRAMDDLTPREGEAVYDALRDESWYVAAARALDRLSV